MAKQYDELPAHEADFVTSKKAPYSKDDVIYWNEYSFTAETLTAGGASVNVTALSTDDSDNYYYDGADDEHDKDMIVLHFTAGRLKGDIGALTTDDNHVSVAYVIARDGTIYKLFDDKYWSYHLGAGAAGGNGTGSKRSVAIELSNVGPLKLKSGTEELYTVKDDGSLANHYCDTSDTAAFRKLDEAYRERTYFATFTDAQYGSLRQLLSYICAKHDIEYKFIEEAKRYDVLSAADAGAWKGIASHVNFRSSGKWDIGEAFDWWRLTGSYSYPVDLGKGLAVSQENAELYYEHTEKTHKGGYFPIGTNTVWHGGLHVHAPASTLVRSCSSGQIAAARLYEAPEDAVGHYGSVNFVLLRHEISGSDLNRANQMSTFEPGETKTWYSVYMHVEPNLIEADNAALDEVQWIRTSGTTGYRTTVPNLPIREQPDPALPFESLANGAELTLATPVPAATPVGNYNWQYVEVTGGDAAHAGQRGWVPCQDDWTDTLTGSMLHEDLCAQLRGGGVVAVSTAARPVRVNGADPLWPIGEYGSPGYRARLVHWEVFSEENLMPAWQHSIDTDDDFNMDAQQIVDLVEQEWFGFDDILTKEEVESFYASNPDAAKLRQWACQFVIEWGVNLAIALPKLKRIRDKIRVPLLKQRITPYLWWDDALNAGVELPASRKVWHYNPAALMLALAAQ